MFSMVSVVFTNPPKLQIQSINTVICTLLACEIGFPRKIDLIYNVDMTARGSLFLLPDYCLNYSHDIDMRYKVWRNHHKVLKAFAATTIDEKIITYCCFIGIDYNGNSYTKSDTYIRSYHYTNYHRYRYTTDIWKSFVPKVNWNKITVLDVGSLKQTTKTFISLLTWIWYFQMTNVFGDSYMLSRQLNL